MIMIFYALPFGALNDFVSRSNGVRGILHGSNSFSVISAICHESSWRLRVFVVNESG